MIKITGGGHRNERGSITYKTERDEPFSLPPEEEKRLVNRGIAEYVDVEPSEDKCDVSEPTVLSEKMKICRTWILLLSITALIAVICAQRPKLLKLYMMLQMNRKMICRNLVRRYQRMSCVLLSRAMIDPWTGHVTITNIKHIMVAPKKIALCSVKPNTPGDG